MSLDDEKKRALYQTAFHRTVNHSGWGNRLTGNCLPACQLILDDVKSHCKDAHIVIGQIYAGSKPETASKEISRIQAFAAGKGPCQTPNFHAWIDIGDDDFLDIVGASWLADQGFIKFNSIDFLDAARARENGAEYVSAIQDPTSVGAFYNNLITASKGNK